jgi:methionyl-tRNA synthetase
MVRYNSELANNLGNLVNRTLNMTNRFAGGVLPAAEGDGGTGACICTISVRPPPATR